MYDLEEAVAIVSNAVMVKTTPQDWVDAVFNPKADTIPIRVPSGFFELFKELSNYGKAEGRDVLVSIYFAAAVMALHDASMAKAVKQLAVETIQ